jgi:hypothetical protein
LPPGFPAVPHHFNLSPGLPNYPLFERDPYLDRIRRAPEFVQFMAEQKARWEKSRQEFGA